RRSYHGMPHRGRTRRLEESQRAAGALTETRGPRRGSCLHCRAVPARVRVLRAATESALNDGSVQDFIFREPATAAIHIALTRRQSFLAGPSSFLRSRNCASFRGLTARLT